MNIIAEEITFFLKENGFNRHLNENETEETEHFYMDRHKPYHIDIQGSCTKEYPYLEMRLIGRKHVEDRVNINTSVGSIKEVIEKIKNKIEEWDTY
jgi:hypothetical protein